MLLLNDGFTQREGGGLCVELIMLKETTNTTSFNLPVLPKNMEKSGDVQAPVLGQSVQNPCFTFFYFLQQSLIRIILYISNTHEKLSPQLDL